MCPRYSRMWQITTVGTLILIIPRKKISTGSDLFGFSKKKKKQGSSVHSTAVPPGHRAACFPFLPHHEKYIFSCVAQPRVVKWQSNEPFESPPFLKTGNYQDEEWLQREPAHLLPPEISSVIVNAAETSSEQDHLLPNQLGPSRCASPFKRGGGLMSTTNL